MSIETTGQLSNILGRGVELGLLGSVNYDDLRGFEFTVNLTGKKYKIDWWVNICYLTTECGAYIPFHGLEISGTWPNHSKTNLQFEYAGNKCVIIPIEDYPVKG